MTMLTYSQLWPTIHQEVLTCVQRLRYPVREAPSARRLRLHEALLARVVSIQETTVEQFADLTDFEERSRMITWAVWLYLQQLRLTTQIRPDPERHGDFAALIATIDHLCGFFPLPLVAAWHAGQPADLPLSPENV